MRLAEIDSLEVETKLQQAIVASDIFKKETTMIWVGASDLAEEGNFYWHGSGKQLVWTNWAVRQPDNKGGNESCVEFGVIKYATLNITWQWNDKNCNVKRYFACEGRQQEQMICPFK